MEKRDKKIEILRMEQLMDEIEKVYGSEKVKEIEKKKGKIQINDDEKRINDILQYQEYQKEMIRELEDMLIGGKDDNEEDRQYQQIMNEYQQEQNQGDMFMDDFISNQEEDLQLNKVLQEQKNKENEEFIEQFLMDSNDKKTAQEDQKQNIKQKQKSSDKKDNINQNNDINPEEFDNLIDEFEVKATIEKMKNKINVEKEESDLLDQLEQESGEQIEQERKGIQENGIQSEEQEKIQENYVKTDFQNSQYQETNFFNDPELE